MRKIFISMMIVLLFATNAFCLDDNSTMDIVSHISGGALVGGLVVYYLPDGMDPYLKWSLGFIAGSLAGVIKEAAIDEIFDDTDWFQWTLGGGIGATLITFTF